MKRATHPCLLAIFLAAVSAYLIFTPGPRASTNAPVKLGKGTTNESPISLQSTQKLAVPQPAAEQLALQAFLNGVKVGAQLRVRNPDASDEELQHIALRMFQQTQPK